MGEVAVRDGVAYTVDTRDGWIIAVTWDLGITTTGRPEPLSVDFRREDGGHVTPSAIRAVPTATVIHSRRPDIARAWLSNRTQRRDIA